MGSWLGVAVVAVVLLGSVPVSAQEAEAPVAWLATGDSYSSGEGVAGNQGDCAQHSSDAYGPAARTMFANDPDGAPVEPFVFTACTGHLAADYFGDVTGAQTGSLYDWSLELLSEQGLSTTQRYDVVTLTFGGNDIDFGEVIMDCLVWLPNSWEDLKIDRPDDCDVTEEQLQSRIDALASDAAIPLDPGNANPNGTLADFYRSVADQHLTPGGQLYILGYPQLFAPSSEWGLWQGTRCNGITRGDANMLGKVANYLDAKLKVAVNNADDGTDRIVYLPVIDLYRNGSHELCGNGDDWINGSITWERDVFSAGFHPNATGHSREAELLVKDHLTDPASGTLARQNKTRRLLRVECPPMYWEMIGESSHKGYGEPTCIEDGWAAAGTEVVGQWLLDVFNGWENMSIAVVASTSDPDRALDDLMTQGVPWEAAISLIGLLGDLSIPRDASDDVRIGVGYGQLLGIPLGGEADRIVRRATEQWGRPTSDTGWGPIDCPALDRFRQVSWGGLTVDLMNVDGEDIFNSYSFRGVDLLDEHPLLGDFDVGWGLELGEPFEYFVRGAPGDTMVEWGPNEFGDSYEVELVSGVTLGTSDQSVTAPIDLFWAGTRPVCS